MLTVNNNKEQWIDSSILSNKVKEWKNKGYILEDVITNLVSRDYKLDGKLVSIKKVISLWNYKELDL